MIGSETLRHAVSEIERLTADDQDPIAHELRVQLEEREWDALVHSPKSQHLLERPAAEARAENDQGETRELTNSL